MRTLTALVFAMLLGGCTQDFTSVEVGDPNAPLPFNGQLTVGQKLEVRVTVERPQMDGPDHYEAVTLFTSDVNVVRTEPGGRGFYLFGIAPGTVTIHAKSDQDPSADFVVTVTGAP